MSAEPPPGYDGYDSEEEDRFRTIQLSYMESTAATVMTVENFLSLSSNSPAVRPQQRTTTQADAMSGVSGTFYTQMTIHEGDDEWFQLTDDAGRSYYHNTKTQETVWTRPEGVVCPYDEDDEEDGERSAKPPPPTSPPPPSSNTIAVPLMTITEDGAEPAGPPPETRHATPTGTMLAASLPQRVTQTNKRRGSFQFVSPEPNAARVAPKVFAADREANLKAGVAKFNAQVRIGTGLFSSFKTRVLEVNVLRQSFAVVKSQKKKDARKEFRAQDVLRMERSRLDSVTLFIVFLNPEGFTITVKFATPGDRERGYSALYAMFFESGSKTGQLSVPISIWMGTWNVGNAAPPAANLGTFVTPEQYDIYVLGAQECNYTFRDETGRTVTCETRDAWYDYVQTILGREYVLIGKHSLWDIRLIVAVKRYHLDKITEVEFAKVATGIASIAGNKGGVAVSFRFLDTTFCFINSHLAAHQGKVADRNANYCDIIKGMKLGRHKNMDITNTADYVFWCGDLNYRIDLPRDAVVEFVLKKSWDVLQANDQLLREKAKGETFVGFEEGELTFPCTYKYDRGSRAYIHSQKAPRIPAWCDRIMWRKLPNRNLRLVSYGCHNDVMTSDHSPVSAVFNIDMLIPFVPLTWTSPMVKCRILLTGICGEGISGAVDTYLAIEANSLQENTYASGIVKKSTDPAWPDMPAPEPFMTDPERLRTEVLILAVMDAKGENISLGEAVVSLKEPCDSAILQEGSRPVEIPFHVPVMKSGVRAGMIRGVVAIAWDQPPLWVAAAAAADARDP